MSPSFHINPKAVVTVLFCVWAVLWSGNVIQDILLASIESQQEIWDRKVWLLDVDFEQSVYTWLSTLLLAFASVIAFVLSAFQSDTGKKFKLQWRAVATILLLMSMDEMLSFHERLGGVVKGVISTSGMFTFAWVIPGIFAVAVIGILFIPFLRSLPRAIALGIFGAGAVFVTGAIGMELFGGWLVSGAPVGTGPYLSPLYRFATSVEEGLEALGVIILIRTLLLQASLYAPEIFKSSEASTLAPALKPHFEVRAN